MSLNTIDLRLGDCLELMKDIPSKSIDLILVDPPYGITKNKWDKVINIDKLFSEYRRIIKDDRAIVMFCAEPLSSKVISSNLDIFKYKWYWKKNKPGNIFHAKNRPLSSVEDIIVFSKGVVGHKGKSKTRMVYNPQGTKDCYVFEYKDNKEQKKDYCYSGYLKSHIRTKTNYPNQLLEFNIVQGAKRINSTQKPTDLLEYLIKTYSFEGDTVLDSCIGSGSTGIACINTKRNFIGIEKNNLQFKQAKERIRNYKEGVCIL